MAQLVWCLTCLDTREREREREALSLSVLEHTSLQLLSPLNRQTNTSDIVKSGANTNIGKHQYCQVKTGWEVWGVNGMFSMIVDSGGGVGVG